LHSTMFTGLSKSGTHSPAGTGTFA
jgi:hypothetical protein